MADELTDKQRVFVEEYLTCWNATEAARRAGYSGNDDTLKSIGSENLTKPYISAFISQRLKEKAMTADEVLARLSDHARASIEDFVTPTGRGFKVDLVKAKKAGKLHLLKKVTKGRQGTTIELVDQQAALINLGKRHRLFNGEDEKKTATEKQPFELPIRVLAPSFIDDYDDITAQLHTEYLEFGGRGSTKSSFISLIFIYLIKTYPTMHLLAMRQVANTLRDSVFAQVQWAINELGLEDEFKSTTSPLEIEYKPTGQKIFFRGADEPGKIKSIKPPFGYIGGLWFEELDQFHGEEAVRKIEQSAIRGGDIAFIFKSFNPPRTANNWANKYVKIPKATQYQHKSTYLDLGARIKWLGKVFVEEAEHLKAVNPKAYEHEYLGIANGTGGLVFENVQIRKITDEEISQFDRILHGQDWGYYPDPAAYTKVHYDAARKILYIFGELRVVKTSNPDLYKMIVRRHRLTAEDTIIADSAEPKSVADFRQYSADGIEALDDAGQPMHDAKGKPVMIYGPSCRGAEKGPDSVTYSMKWLQSLAAIVIDPERCPESAEEFLSYELEQDKDGNFISEYPDKNNHSIDAVRYATNLIWRRRGQ